jgi:hypothetical protein
MSPLEDVDGVCVEYPVEGTLVVRRALNIHIKMAMFRIRYIV